MQGAGTLTQLVPAVQNNWHTTLSRDVISYGSTDQDEIDEAYREGLSHRLQPPLSNSALPSADFLNLCIKLYFVRFNPVFPLLHAPSFRPSSENALLLLSVCSVGALFMGSASAAMQGRRIFQMLNKAILASWDSYIRRDSREVLSLVQAATIGQTFGMLSGQPSDLCMTESFHGTVIAWARQGGFFKMKEPTTVFPDDLGISQEEIWKTWAHTEEAARLVLGLYVHDSEFATTFHHEPLLRHRLDSLPLCSSDDIFFAPNPSEWHRLLELERDANTNTVRFRQFASGITTPSSILRKSHMYEYASLAGIVASIQERKGHLLDQATIQYFRNMLLIWHGEHNKHTWASKTNHLNLMIFWHLAFMALYVNFDLLERSIGRDGRVIAEQARREAHDWAASSEARRGVLHSLLVLKYLEMLPIGVEPAIHVPKSVFYAAIVVYSYIKLKPTDGAYTPSQEEVNIPELQVSGSSGPANQSSERASSAIFSPVEPSFLCSAIDLLRRIGHWEASRKFASILEPLLEDLATAP
ncbi:fungal-specific transcription factor domain-containing protein [Mariannaea sp. PMI_226]|nr:fungal-specific transcription factor domain-containing protein [Mariannaea sp. PMI_226]